MNEYIYAEFMFSGDYRLHLNDMVKDLGEDMSIIRSENIIDQNTLIPWTLVSVKIKSVAATALALSKKSYLTHMRTSFISEEMKDRYRKR